MESLIRSNSGRGYFCPAFDVGTEDDMVFSSLYFLFIFFPVVLFLHLVLPSRAKNLILLLASIFFYAWGEPVYVVLMLFSTVFNYILALDIDRKKNLYHRRSRLCIAVVVNLLMLGFFKYYGFCIQIINLVTPLDIPVRTLDLPIGISFYTFQALSYDIDVYRGTVKAQRSLLRFAVYLTMFPQLVAGPIVKYTDIEAQLAKRKIPFLRIARGGERFVIGLAKKVLLANNLGLLYTTIQNMSERSVVTAWLGIAAYTMQIYFDFSGYSDMAIGIGHMLGFSFPENFAYPYLSKSVSEFWRRWHMTLSFWFRDYVYIPLGGSRVHRTKQIRNILIVWMLTGLWHGASWNFVLWGLYYGLLLLLEKFVLKSVLRKLPASILHGYTMLAVMLGWVLFSNTDIVQACSYLANLFGIGASGLIDTAGQYYLQSNLILLVLAAVCCTPVPAAWFKKQIKRKPLAASAAIVGIFLLSTAYLVYSSYNPFLYFRF